MHVHTWPQIVAAILLGLEVATGLMRRHRPVRNYYGYTRLGDAALWTLILWRGGFFVS